VPLLEEEELEERRVASCWNVGEREASAGERGVNAETEE
jgi:hypothetical protein